MPPLTNSRQEAFVQNWVEAKPQYECAILAGYSPRSAAMIASRLLTKDKILARYKELQEIQAQKLIDATVATKLESGQVATEIMRARFSDFDIDNITQEQLKSAAIREISRQHFKGGKNGRAEQVTTKIKLESPLQAADYLAKLYGWYTPSQVDISGEVRHAVVNVHFHAWGEGKPFKKVTERAENDDSD